MYNYKYIITTVLLCITSLIYGQASIESIIGISDNGLANQTTFSLEVSHEKAIDFQLGFYINSDDYEDNNQNIEIPIDVFAANIGAVKRINFLSTQKVNTKINGGFSFGAELINEGSKELENGALLTNTGGFMLGAYVGASTAFKISNKFSAVMRYTSFFHNSNISPSRFIAGAGLQYNF